MASRRLLGTRTTESKDAATDILVSGALSDGSLSSAVCVAFAKEGLIANLPERRRLGGGKDQGNTLRLLRCARAVVFLLSRDTNVPIQFESLSKFAGAVHIPQIALGVDGVGARLVHDRAQSLDAIVEGMGLTQQEQALRVVNATKAVLLSLRPKQRRAGRRTNPESPPRQFESQTQQAQRTPQLPSRGRRWVFISAASEDYPLARRVFEFLRQNGLSAFFSDVSLPERGNSRFCKEVDAMLERARHFVLVASSRRNASKPWVMHEWSFFLNEKIARRKVGNLLTLAAGDLKPKQLPASLRQFEVLPLTDDGLDRALSYLR